METINLINKNYESSTIYNGFHGYHSHERDGYNAPVGVKAPKYMMGVELETIFVTDAPRDDRDRFCHNFRSNWVYCEEDGSLPRGGCEFITIPLRPVDACSPSTWIPLIRTLASHKVRSCGHSETGLHVHITRTVFGASEQEQSDGIGRLLYLYNYALSQDFRRGIFGRGNTSYATQMPSTSKAEATRVLKDALKYKDVSKAVCKELSDYARGERYYQINLRNAKTIEFRQGKGTINAQRLAAICEFVRLLCEYAKTKTNLYNYSQADFMDYANKKCNEALRGYLFNEI